MKVKSTSTTLKVSREFYWKISHIKKIRYL